MRDVNLREKSLPQKIKSPVLISQRLILRLPHSEDIESLVLLADNPQIAARFDEMPRPFSRADAEDFVRRAENGQIGYYVYAITRADTGEFIGCCGIGAYKGGRWADLAAPAAGGAALFQAHQAKAKAESGQNPAETEVFFWLGEPFRGQGYGEEVLIALVDVAFRATDIDVLYARAHTDNAAARKILQKCGFSLLRTGGHAPAGADKVQAIAHYCLDRESWLRLRSR